MLKPKQEKKNEPVKPALKIRSGVNAGASVDACLDNLQYWQNAYYNRCGLLK